MSSLLVAEGVSDNWQPFWAAWLIVVVIVLLMFFSFFGMWIQAFFTGARISPFDLIGMRLRKIDMPLIVRTKIALVQAGVQVENKDLEAHFLARGNVAKVAAAVIAAHKAGIDLPWRIAAAIDLAGRDILDAVKTSVNPKVIDCPDPNKGRPTLDGVCKNGIQLKARARVTVRTKLDRLVGGATEETIIARVRGIVKAISAEHHRRSPARCSFHRRCSESLDSQTAFEIVSIDVAEIDVNQHRRQPANRPGQRRLRGPGSCGTCVRSCRRAQEMTALVEENRADRACRGRNSSGDCPGLQGAARRHGLHNAKSAIRHRNGALLPMRAIARKRSVTSWLTVVAELVRVQISEVSRLRLLRKSL